MARIQVELNIKNNDGEQTLTTKGVLKNNEISFFDDNNQRHSVTWDTDKVYYQRTGENAFEFVFELNTKHPGYYHILTQVLVLSVNTRFLLKTEKMIEVIYDIEQDSEVINTSHLKLSYIIIKGAHHDSIK